MLYPDSFGALSFGVYSDAVKDVDPEAAAEAIMLAKMTMQVGLRTVPLQ